MPICNNFSQNVCTYLNCQFLYICSSCKDAHPQSVPSTSGSLHGRRTDTIQRHHKQSSLHSNKHSISSSRTMNSSRSSIRRSPPHHTFSGILDQGPLIPYCHLCGKKSSVSSQRSRHIISQLLEKEVNNNNRYITGSFQSPPFSVFYTSPIGVAIRKYSAKKRFSISPLLAPAPFRAIISFIQPELFSLHYATVDNAIKLIKLAMGFFVRLMLAPVLSSGVICPRTDT